MSGEVDMRRDEEDDDVADVWVMCWAPMTALCESDEHTAAVLLLMED